MIRIAYTLILTLFTTGLLAQNKLFFDKLGKSTTEAQAYYYRQKEEGADMYKSYYINGGTLFFEGKISKPSNTDEEKNGYNGLCIWYYKNGKKKASRMYNEKGVEEGISTWYYESGKLWKEIEYKNGQIKDNTYKEYDEAGQASRIFEEEFGNNINDWDLYHSDKSQAVINNGVLELSSYSAEGTSRYIHLPMLSGEFTIEAVFNLKKLKAGEKAGIIYGFKDWQNYNFFSITQSAFYIGTVYEGATVMRAEGMYSSAINKEEQNLLKVITDGDKNIYSINGEIQMKTDRYRSYGSHVGFAISGNASVDIEKLICKEIDFKSSSAGSSDRDVKASGSGFLFSSKGYLLTNYHVVENANKISVELNNGTVNKTYTAEVVQKDVDNDLAILKVNDAVFTGAENVQYAFKDGAMDVGSQVFTIGYPLAMSGMGKEAKFADGKISAKTGYNNAVNSYQTSIPVQPGNSGGPLFNDKGQLIGIINAKVSEADNVSYAVKVNYIRNLIELLPETITAPADNTTLINATLEEKIKQLSKYVYLIKIK